MSSVNNECQPKAGVNLIELDLDLGACELLCPRLAGLWTERERASLLKEKSEAGNANPQHAAASRADLMDSIPLLQSLPACYATNTGVVPPGRFPQMAIETLFYAFYNMPRTQAQISAALEAMSRGWQLHRALSKWIHPAYPVPLSGSEKSLGPTQGLPSVWFDPVSWSIRALTGPYPAEPDLVRLEEIEACFQV